MSLADSHSIRRSRAATRRATPSFNLVRWFAAVSAVAVLALAGGSALFLERFLRNHMLGRDAAIMTNFVNGIVRVEDAAEYFATSGADRASADMDEFVRHLGLMPGVLRANAYGLDRSILWSTESDLVGRRFTDNDELEEAFLGVPVVHSGVVGATDKREHAKLNRETGFFVENYLPIWDPSGMTPTPVGVIEVYRTPHELFAAIEEGRGVVWTGAAIAAAALYAALFGLVLRADGVIRRQSDALAETRTMAALGEMASAVAHSLRNPLAAIRSSAELAHDETVERERRALMDDVMAHVDRMEVSIRQYLSYDGAPDDGVSDRSDLDAAVAKSLDALARQLGRAGIEATVRGGAVGCVLINPILLDQVLHSLLANAIEAMPEGGRLTVSLSAETADTALVAVRDTGAGLADGAREKAFTPFGTTKRNGLGMGLPLARQIVVRQGGALTLDNAPGGGAEARLRLRRAEP